MTKASPDKSKYSHPQTSNSAQFRTLPQGFQVGRIPGRRDGRDHPNGCPAFELWHLWLIGSVTNNYPRFTNGLANMKRAWRGQHFWGGWHDTSLPIRGWINSYFLPPRLLPLALHSLQLCWRLQASHMHEYTQQIGFLADCFNVGYGYLLKYDEGEHTASLTLGFSMALWRNTPPGQPCNKR